MSFNERDMWENQVQVLAKHCQRMTRKIDEIEQRLHYFEGVVATLLVALKEGGVIVEKMLNRLNTSFNARTGLEGLLYRPNGQSDRDPQRGRDCDRYLHHRHRP